LIPLERNDRPLEVFKILGKIAIEGAEAAKDTLGGLGNAAAKTGKAIAAGLAAGAAAVGVVAKAAVESYAEYEQLVGGVETLYGQSIASAEEYAQKHGVALEYAEDVWREYEKRQQDVLDNAANAYRTAGLSANEYMNTVNGFAASLTSSLGEYEWQAAHYANMIVTDMADNANKMGTSMEAIQNAYSGFAKQNYTMLDNLKLGYGGTKEEMERLMRDAEKFAGYIEGSLNIDSFADVAEAIHIIQDELGIYGTTENEALSTIQGSMSATKSAWKNLLTGFADEGADLGLLVQNLVDSATVAMENLVPRIAVILSGIADALSLIMPVIAAELPSLLQQLLPGLIDGAVALTVGLLQALPSIVNVLAAELPNILGQIFAALVAAFPEFCVALTNLMATLAAPIAEGLLAATEFLKDVWVSIKTWVSEKIVQPVVDLFTSIGDSIKNGFKSAVNWIIEGINGFVRGVNKIKVPDWVPLVGGKGFAIKEIPLLEEGGVLERGQTGFLEGNGAEAVVPLDQNKKWISAVADTMSATMGGGETAVLLEAILEAIRDTNNITEEMKTAFENWKMVINNREFARMVKAVG
jgi:hypothetical protein